jgi:Predicted aminoglycoside phosphotransferase
MARSHLTLAALATSAVPGLDVAGTRSYSYGAHGEFDSALLTVRDGDELIIRVPTSQAAETEQSADLVALRSLTAGIRGRLPFDVPTYVGQAPLGGTRAVLYEYLPGDKVELQDIAGGDGLASSIGRSIAAIHALPTAFVGDAGLPVLTAADSRETVSALVDTASGTGKLPAALRERWRSAVADEALWRFQPTVVNGAMSIESILVREETVVGVLGWSALRVGDPARDLHWLLAMRQDALESALGAYAAERAGADDRQATQRAMLYAELEVARWLLHGREVHDSAIVDDAVQMLDGLVERVHSDSLDPLAPITGPIMAVTDVVQLLDATPVARDSEDVPGLLPVADDTSEHHRLPRDEDD